jgi:Ca2+-binding RTX toxin-like protein
MLTLTPARIGGRTRRALLAAALTAAAAVPATADAATVTTSGTKNGTILQYRAAAGEVNDVRVSLPGARIVISDQVPITAGGTCVLNAAGDAECANVDLVRLELGDRNDVLRYSAPHQAVVNAGSGSDTFIAGLRQLTRPSQGVLTYNGGDGTDTVTYAQTNRPVTVTLGTGGNDDGRAGEHEDVGDDVELVEGSPFDDTLTGSNLEQRERFTGGAGADTIAGLGGPDVFHEGSTPNGADTYNGGAGLDLVDYSQRTRPVSVSLDLNRNDGEAAEADFIDPNVNDVFGGSAGDVITGGAGANALIGNGGDDTLFGFGGDDRLDGGAGFDELFGGTENDVVESADNAPDRIRCDSGQDTLNRDLQDVDASGCEVVNSVGTLELAPKALTADAGELAKLRLSWTHPQSWKRLRDVTLRLRLRDRVVGSIAMHPRRERITGRGATRLVRSATRLARHGKTVTARLAFRLDGTLAGQTLKADVEATDARGRRQLERAAATVRVAP